MKENVVREKSYAFALRIIDLSRGLIVNREYVLSKQVLRAGTSIGANVEEALAAQSRPDFIAKMSIASKEARECNYWLRLLRDSGTVPKDAIDPFIADSSELVLILTSIVKSARESSS